MRKSAGMAIGACITLGGYLAFLYLWNASGSTLRYTGGEIAADDAGREEPPLRSSAAMTRKFFCTFTNTPGECGFRLQAKAMDRAEIVNIGREGARSLQLRTEPGDTNVAGSGGHERADVYLSQEHTGCYEGQEQRWEHSILFPDDYAVPPPSGWNVVFDFHHTGSTGQANFHVVATSEGLNFLGFGGEKVNHGAPSERAGRYEAPIGPVERNVWYDFVYHVKWSSGDDGFFTAWVNGARKLAHRGPTLYEGLGCYLKLANYHTASERPTSVIHDRVIRHDLSPQ